MAVEMSLHLTFSFGHETQAPRIPQSAGNEAEPESAGIPERIQQRRPITQIVQALACPGQVIGLFVRSFKELSAQAWIARHGCLGCVKRLCTDFSDMVDSHERAGLAALFLVHLSGSLGRDGHGSRCVRASKKGAQSRICCGENGVKRERHSPI